MFILKVNVNIKRINYVSGSLVEHGYQNLVI